MSRLPFFLSTHHPSHTSQHHDALVSSPYSSLSASVHIKDTNYFSGACRLVSIFKSTHLVISLCFYQLFLSFIYLLYTVSSFLHFVASRRLIPLCTLQLFSISSFHSQFFYFSSSCYLSSSPNPTVHSSAVQFTFHTQSFSFLPFVLSPRRPIQLCTLQPLICILFNCLIHHHAVVFSLLLSLLVARSHCVLFSCLILLLFTVGFSLSCCLSSSLVPTVYSSAAYWLVFCLPVHTLGPLVAFLVFSHSCLNYTELTFPSPF